MSAIESVADRKDRPAYVRFVKRAVEDKAESLKQGRFVAKDVDFALITPPYSRDVVEQKVVQWLDNMDRDVNMGRLPAEWRDAYKEGYRKWQNGQEMPLSGTPIRGWPVISPAQQENLIRMSILTVEDMAGINDEGAKRLGLGWLELKNKAIAWLRAAEDRGGLTQEMAQLKQDNANLTAQVSGLLEKVEQLKQMIPAPHAVAAPETEITADDILPENEPPRRRK
jgi:hypothetical protein